MKRELHGRVPRRVQGWLLIQDLDGEPYHPVVPCGCQDRRAAVLAVGQADIAQSEHVAAVTGMKLDLRVLGGQLAGDDPGRPGGHARSCGPAQNPERILATTVQAPDLTARSPAWQVFPRLKLPGGELARLDRVPGV